MRNFSETGVLIEFKDGFLTPNRFSLHNDLDGYDVECEVVRRVGNFAGCKFVSEPSFREATRTQVIDMNRYQVPRIEETDNQPIQPTRDVERKPTGSFERVAPTFGKKSASG